MRCHFPDHAKERLEQRGIRELWVVDAIANPQYSEPDPNNPKRTKVYKAIPERNNKILVVVYEKRNDYLVVVTVFTKNKLKGIL